MNSNKFTISTVALLLGLSTALASAQPREREDRKHGGPPAHAPGHGHQDQRADNHRHDRGRGAGPDHRYHKGDRLPKEWRSHQYVVNDWRGHHLKQPPRGYHWVQSGTDYILVAIATGVIAQIILNQ